jgi:hypothetical protein
MKKRVHLWTLGIFPAAVVLGLGLVAQSQDNAKIPLTPRVIHSTDILPYEEPPEWLKEVRYYRMIGEAQKGREILREHTPANLRAEETLPLAPLPDVSLASETSGDDGKSRIQWANPDTPIFDFGVREQNPDITARTTVAGAPDLYVVAEKLSGGSFDDLVIRRSTNHGLTWGPIKTISDTMYALSAPRIVQILPEYLGIVYEMNGLPVFMKMNATNFDEYTSWYLDNYGGHTYFKPAITSDIVDYPGGPYLYAVWFDYNPGWGVYVYFRRSEDGGATWAAYQSLFVIGQLLNAGQDYRLSLSIKNDALYCAISAYRDANYSFDVVVRKSLDYGNTWSSSQYIANTGNSEKFASVAAADANHALCVYQRYGLDRDIYYAYTQNGGSSWITDNVLSNTDDDDLGPDVKATVPANEFYVGFQRAGFPAQIRLTKAPFADPNSAAWTSLGNVKNSSNNCPFDKTVAILAKSNPAGGTSASAVWSEWSAAGDGDVFFDAGWLPQHTLTLTKGGTGNGTVKVNGSSYGLPTTADFFLGATVSLEAVPDKASSFTSWGGDLGGTANPTSIAMTSDKSVTVNFDPLITTIAASPAGRLITVDGEDYKAPQTFKWEAGSSHTISAPSPQAGGGGIRYVFVNWSDGGGQSHTITTPAVSTTYTANFTTQYLLTKAANPAAGGTIVATPASADGYYNSGQAVQLRADANPGYAFANWSGDLTGTANPQNVGMNAPKSVTANFNPVAATSVTVASPNGGEVWNGLSGHSITWTTTGAVTGVKIEYSTDGGSTWSLVVITGNDGTYEWTVPNASSSTCRVKVSNSNDLSVFDVSDANFTIVEKVFPKKDLLGTWIGQGVFFRNSETGQWSSLATPANLIAAGDLSGDGKDDLIGTWPTQAGVWARNSADGSWAYLSSTARHIAAGDMNGDGRTDFLGAWDGQGVYYRDSLNGQWTQLATPAVLITAGDLDGDNSDDLIGIWLGQPGVWWKHSQNGLWERIADTAVDLAVGDMNGDGIPDFVGSWEDQGVFYLNNDGWDWVRMASEAEQIATGDLDGDNADDLIGVWPGQAGIWVKYSKDGSWANLGSTALDIAAGFMAGGTWSGGLGEFFGPAGSFFGRMSGPGKPGFVDSSEQGPGGKGFRPAMASNLSPRISRASSRRLPPGPGEPGFRFVSQKNLVPGHKEPGK